MIILRRSVAVWREETRMIEERDKYIVYSTRPEGNVNVFYFWTGDRFSGDLSKALIHQKYGDCARTIWRGVLREKYDRVEELGFEGLYAFPLHSVDKEIKPEWRGKDEFKI